MYMFRLRLVEDKMYVRMITISVKFGVHNKNNCRNEKQIDS